MKISLMTAHFVNNNLKHNINEMVKGMRLAKQHEAKLVCFGEAFLQGFDSLTWIYEHDREVAISTDSDAFQILIDLSSDIQIDLMFGFLERDGEKLFSSCALVGDGGLLHLYRRISKGWKEYDRADFHYCEGGIPQPFCYRGMQCMIAICGDLWEYPSEFARGEDVLFWPVFINYPIAEWKNGVENEYAQQAACVCKEVLLVDSLGDEKNVFGGCCRFSDGCTVQSLETGEEGMLTVEI